MNRIRLKCLDGIRGFAAFYVLLSHESALLNNDIFSKQLQKGVLTQGFNIAHFVFLSYGRYAVDLFIVLSGFCLMLPVATSPDAQLPKGLPHYFCNRARRIVPAYYAALVLSIVLILLVPGMNHRSGCWWDTALPAITSGAILSHLLLMHCYSAEWERAIDMPMWSVAVEWQIYFLFPLILLPVWRRLGSGAAVGAAIAIGLGCVYPSHTAVEIAQPWMLALFAFGMGSASVCFSRSTQFTPRVGHVACRNLIAALLSIIVLTNLLNRGRWSGIHWVHLVTTAMMQPLWPMDFVVGAAVALGLVQLTRQAMASENQRPSLLLRAAGSKIGAFCGSISYSLYLLHAPLLAVIALECRKLHATVGETTLAVFAGGTAVALLLSYLFSVAFEKPFLSARSRAEGAYRWSQKTNPGGAVTNELGREKIVGS